LISFSNSSNSFYSKISPYSSYF